MARITISFKDSEEELYKKVCASSCSPTAFIKDVLIKYFKDLETQENQNEMKQQPRRSFIDNIEI